MKFTSKNARKFGWDGLVGWAFNEKKDFPNATTAYVETTSRHGKIKNTRSDVVYYIVSGNGRFYLANKWFDIKRGEVVIVPKNTVYDFKAKSGKLKLFIVHTPGYDPKHDEHFE